MTPGEQRMKNGLEQAGWTDVVILPERSRRRGPGGVEAMGRDEPGGRYTIWADGGRDGQLEGYELVRGEEPGSPAASSGRARWAGPAPTPAQAVGAWEEAQAREGRPC